MRSVAGCMASIFPSATQASLEEFAGLNAAQQAALLEPWQLPSSTHLNDVSAASDLPAVTGPAGKRHKA